jgi:D-lactate dehydrogenase (cytochrome)
MSEGMVEPRIAGDRMSVIDAVQALLGDRLATGMAVRDHHSHGEGLPATGLPDAVAFAHTNEEIAAIARLCNDAGVPLVPFGAGTSLEGHVAAVRGGICLDLSQMTSILTVSPWLW